MNPVRNIYTIAKIFIVCALMYLLWPYIHNVIGMLIVAFFITTILLPTVDWLEGKFKNRILAVFTIMIVVIALFFAFFAIFVYEVGGETKNISQQYLNKDIIDSAAKSYENLLQNMPPAVSKIISSFFDKKTITSKLNAFAQNIVSQILNVLGQFYKLIFNFIMTLIFTVMLLAGYHNFKKSLVSLVGNSRFELFLRMSYQIEQQISKYLRGQMKAAARIAFLTIIFLLLLNLLWSANVKMVFFLGIIAGLASLIPIIGIFIGMLPAIIIALIFNLQNPAAASSFFFIPHIVIIYIIIYHLDKTVLSPVLVSKKIGLHPLLVLIALILGANLWGPMGILLAVPITGVIKVIVNESVWFLRKSKEFAQNREKLI
ncbi:MAG: AI-2E family transporter [Candidatus Cloacimonadota bacterium]|nr:AI-2E family transporter [Candidatus Cloacimonadota bacterium]